MIAKLPEKYREAPKRYLKDIAIGETVHVVFTDMHVDAEGSCFLNADAELRSSNPSTCCTETR